MTGDFDSSRRRFLGRVVLGATAFGAVGMGGVTGRTAQSSEPAGCELTVESAASTYQQVEALIKQRLEEAHASGKKLKIMFGDVHNAPQCYLAMLMVYDIARRLGIKHVALEGSAEGLSNASRAAANYRDKDFVQFTHGGIMNPENFFYYALAGQRKYPENMDFIIRGLESEAIDREMAKHEIQSGTITLEQLKNPQKWAEDYLKLAQQLVEFDAQREKTMTIGILKEPVDELVICGVAHLDGIHTLMSDAEDVQTLVLFSSYPNQDLKRRATIHSEALLKNINPFKLGIDPSVVEAMKTKLYDTMVETITQHDDLSELTTKDIEFMRHKATPMFDAPLPAEYNNVRGALNMLRKVKEKLGHEQIVQTVPGIAESDRAIV